MQLRLSLKKHWFELTKSNQKKEEYREITEYWFKRLVYDHKKVYEYYTSILGYSSKMLLITRH